HAEGTWTGPRPQVAWLDFAGGDSVQIGGEPIENMRTFSAESISGRLNGQTAAITDMIIEKMQQDFAAYNVQLFNSKHHTKPYGAGRVRIADPGPKPDTSFRDGMELSNFPVLKCGRGAEGACD